MRHAPSPPSAFMHGRTWLPEPRVPHEARNAPVWLTSRGWSCGKVLSALLHRRGSRTAKEATKTMSRAAPKASGFALTDLAAEAAASAEALVADATTALRAHLAPDGALL